MLCHVLHHVRDLTMPLIRVRLHSFGYTRIHIIDIDELAFAHAAMSNTDLVSHVAVKLSTFWVKDPAVRFIQTETNFRHSRITSQQTIFDYVLKKLPEDVTTSIRDVLVSISNSTGDPYGRIKTPPITDLNALSLWQRAENILPRLWWRMPQHHDGNDVSRTVWRWRPEALFWRRLSAEIKHPFCTFNFYSPRAMA